VLEAGKCTRRRAMIRDSTDDVAFCAVNQTKYFSEGFIYVMNGNSAPLPPTDKNAKRTVDAWVARILEIRASDEHHVYARVYWMYWPEELPPGVLPDGKRTPAGRQPYHGKSELIASNHSKSKPPLAHGQPTELRVLADMLQWISSTWSA
jgi:hypothetical protein